MSNRLMMCSLVLLSLACGCARTRQSADQASSGNPSAPAISVMHQRVRAIAEHTRRLPGRNFDEDRATTEKVFADIVPMLEALNRRGLDGAFNQQLDIIRDTQGTLAGKPSEGRAENVTAQGLRATYNALRSLRQTQLPEDEQSAATLDRLGSKLAELDTVRGPIHRLVASQAIGIIADAGQQMADALQQQETPLAADEAPAATQPAR